ADAAAGAAADRLARRDSARAAGDRHCPAADPAAGAGHGQRRRRAPRAVLCPARHASGVGARASGRPDAPGLCLRHRVHPRQRPHDAAGKLSPGDRRPRARAEGAAADQCLAGDHGRPRPPSGGRLDRRSAAPSGAGRSHCAERQNDEQELARRGRGGEQRQHLRSAATGHGGRVRRGAEPGVVRICPRRDDRRLPAAGRRFPEDRRQVEDLRGARQRHADFARRAGECHACEGASGRPDLRSDQRFARRVLGAAAGHRLGDYAGNREGGGDRQMTMVERTIVWVKDDRTRRLAYLVLAAVSAILIFFPRPYVASAQIVPQDTAASASSTTALLGALGGQATSIGSLLSGGRPSNDLYLVLGRSDAVKRDVIKTLHLVGPQSQFTSERKAMLWMDCHVDFHLLLGGGREIDTKLYDPERAREITGAYAAAIGRSLATFGRQITANKRKVVELRFGSSQARVADAEAQLANFRRANNLADPQMQLGNALSQRATLEGQLQAKQVQYQAQSQLLGPENTELIALQTEIAG